LIISFTIPWPEGEYVAALSHWSSHFRC